MDTTTNLAGTKLEPLLERPRTLQPTEVIPETIPVQRPPRTRRSRPALYDKIGLTLAYACAGLIAMGLWYLGAFFTLAALRALGANTASLLWWTVPVGITAIEIWLMPRRGMRWQALAIFLVILILDVCSSWYGVVETTGGLYVPLGTGFTIPEAGSSVHAFAIVVSLLFAFMPEKLARWSVAELLDLWS